MESSHTVFLYPWPQEAAELSSLKPQLDELGVPLYAMVKEDVGTEVQNFRPYFKGEIFLDKKVPFFVLITGNSCGLLWNSKQTLLKPVLSCVISHCVRTKVIFDQNCFSSAWPFKGFMRFFAEALLWTPWEEDGSVGIPPSWGVDERPEGLSEGLHGKCFGRGICSWWSLCDWKRRAGKSLSISYEFGDKSTFPQC